MRSTFSKALLVAASVAMLSGPALAQAGPGDGGGFQPPGPGGSPPDQPRKRRHHHDDVGAGIAAGVLGGIAGAAIGASRPRPPGYDYPPPPPPPGPRYGAYDEDVTCRMVRKPVYDEDGDVVSYRTRRICD